MFNVMTIDNRGRACIVDNYGTVEQAIQQTLEDWHEDDGALRRLFWIEDKHDFVIATLHSGADQSIAHVCVLGTAISYKVKYILTENGSYHHTKITRI